MNEAKMTLKNRPLTQAEVMTIRVALNAFIMDLSDPVYLGKDETGKSIRNGYLEIATKLTEEMITP